MKRFAFGLQRLLELRTQYKRAVAAQLGKMEERRRRVEDEMAATEKEWMLYRRQLVAPRKLVLHERMEISRYLGEVENRLVILQSKYARVLEDMKETRRDFEAANRAEQVLVKLKARKLEEFNLRLARAEQHILDEIAGQKTWRQNVWVGTA